MYRDVFWYDRDALKNKKVVIYGCDENAIGFAVRLFNENIDFDYFLFPEKEVIKEAYLLNRKVLSIQDLESNYVIITSYLDYESVREKLETSNSAKYLILFENIHREILHAENIVLYGTGRRAKRVWDEYGEILGISHIVDSDSKKWGKDFEGKRILSLDEVILHEEGTAIIIGSTFLDEIYQKLMEHGVNERKVFSIKYAFKEGQLEIGENKFLGKPIRGHKQWFCDIIYECTNHKTIIFGKEKDIAIVKKIFCLLKINAESVIFCEKENEKSIYSLLYYDSPQSIFVFLDEISEEYLAKLKMLGIEKKKVYFWRSFDSFHEEGTAYLIQSLDVNLGYTYKSSSPNSEYGFMKYEFDTGESEPVRILALGGSTTYPYTRGMCWSQILSQILKENGISHCIYNGGIVGYRVGQEFVKLFRDGLNLKPDIVISYSGVNDMYERKYPLAHYRQKELFKIMVEHMERYTNVNYGVPAADSPFESWLKYEKMMKAVCEEFGIKFKAFLQPNLYMVDGLKQRSINLMANEGVFIDSDENTFFVFDEELLDLNMREHIKISRDFRNQILKVLDSNQWLCNLSGLFDTRQEVYIDSCHIFEEGNRIVAEKIYGSIKQFIM